MNMVGMHVSGKNTGAASATQPCPGRVEGTWLRLVQVHRAGGDRHMTVSIEHWQPHPTSTDS